jgi:hypothetical protein
LIFSIRPGFQKNENSPEVQDIFHPQKRLSRKRYKNKEHYYVLLEHKLYRARVAQPDLEFS